MTRGLTRTYVTNILNIVARDQRPIPGLFSLLSLPYMIERVSVGIQQHVQGIIARSSLVPFLRV
jgi:hypothetical protein